MSRHMGIQIPLLILAGWLLARSSFWSARTRGYIRQYRVAIMIAVSFAIVTWMIPRMLDEALANLSVEVIKFVTLPLAGAALALSWPQLGFVARGVLHMEALAMLPRAGWLYLITPERLCVNYGLADQQWLGQGMLIAAMIYALWLGARFFWGDHRAVLQPHQN